MQRDIYAEQVRFSAEQSLVVQKEKGMKMKMDSLDRQHHEAVLSWAQQHPETIRYVQLTGNSYGDEFMKEFGEVLSPLTITHLGLNNIFVSRLNTEIPPALLNLTACLKPAEVRFLDLSNNAIAPNGVQALSDFLKATVNLETLMLNNSGIGYLGAQSLEPALSQGGKNLKVLAIARSRMLDEGCKAIAKAVESLPKLAELHLYSNSMRESLSGLLVSLLGCPQLEVLDLSDNQVYLETAQLLGPLLQKCPRLRALNLNDCNMDEKTNEVVLHHLESQGDHLLLSKLGYKYNELVEAQPMRLLELFFRPGRKVERLEISGNDFEEDVKELYLRTLHEQTLPRLALSKFESDEEDEEYDDLEETANENLVFDELYF